MKYISLSKNLLNFFPGEFTSNATLIPVYLVNASIQNKTTAQHILNAGSDSSNTAFCKMVREWHTKTSNKCINDSRDKIAAEIEKKIASH